MRILVTGGTGFLGPHIVKALQAAGHHCVVLDIRPSHSSLEYLVGDLTNLDDCLRATADVDAICHLGAIGDVYLAFEKPYLAAAVNTLGTANLLEAAQRGGRVRKVVYTSTWEVYGKPHYQPIDELHPCEPDHPYNITKLAGERMALAYDNLKGVPTIALRLGTAYGTGMRPNSVFSLFADRAKRREPIIINGDGKQFRQFTHVSDIARAFVLAVESDLRGEVFNIVGIEQTSIRELAEMIIDTYPTNLQFKPARPGDIAPAVISSRKAQSLLGWKPIVSMREGLRELVDSFPSNSEQRD